MKPTVDLLNCDGNIFALLGCASKGLRKAKQDSKANEMTSKVSKARNYDEALSIILEYVEVKSND